MGPLFLHGRAVSAACVPLVGLAVQAAAAEDKKDDDSDDPFPLNNLSQVSESAHLGPASPACPPRRPAAAAGSRAQPRRVPCAAGRLVPISFERARGNLFSIWQSNAGAGVQCWG